MVNIKGLDKARVLKALYDYAGDEGPGHLRASREITVEDCAKALERTTHFEYLCGHLMTVDLSGDEFDPCVYDLHHGKGAAQRAVDSIRGEQKDSEEKERSLEEKRKDAMEAINKITKILVELPPDIKFATAMYLKMFVLDPVMPRYTLPPIAGLFGGVNLSSLFK